MERVDAMAIESGIGGSFKYGTVVVASLGKWSISMKGGLVKTTPFGASGSWEVNTGTIKSWTATAEGWLDPADTLGQTALANVISSTVAVTFYVDATHNWSGNAILTGVDDMADSQGVNTRKFSFTGAGNFVFT